METRRFANIQALRGLAVLLVLGRHMQICIERLLGETQLLRAFVLGDIGVDLFFVISGFVLVISTRGHFTHWRQGGVFLYHRITRIYPLYWLYTLPTLGVYWFHRELMHRYDKNEPISVVKSLLLWPQERLPILGQGWSLTFELYFYLVFVCLLFLSRFVLVKGLLLWALGVAMVNAWFVFGGVHVQMRPEWWIVCNLQSVEFVAGAMVGVAVQDGWLVRAQRREGWLSIGGGGVWMGLVLLPLGFQLLNGDRVLGYAVPALSLVLGAVILELRGVPLPSALGRIGKYSYSIYLSHILVLGGLVQFWPWRKPHGLGTEAVIELLMLCCAIGVGAASYHFVEQPLLVWSRRWRSSQAWASLNAPTAPISPAHAQS